MILDTNFVRSQFPAFDPGSDFNTLIYVDNGGAAFVPRHVVTAMVDYLTKYRLQPFSPTSVSTALGQRVDEAYRRFATFIGAEPNEVVFNASTSANFYMLSRAMRGFVREGDEIVVTDLDHECNIGFWRREAEQLGAVVKVWQFDLATASLRIEDLECLLSPKTKLVAFTHCSSVTGEINDVKAIARLCRAVGAKTAVDGVSYAPHRIVDVKDLGVDFYSFSIYKMFGPHLGLLYIRSDNYSSLVGQSHYFLTEKEYRKRFSPSGPQYGEILGAAAVLDYFDTLYSHHSLAEANGSPGAPFRHSVVFSLIQEHETKLMTSFINAAFQKPHLRLIGPSKVGPLGRIPNIALISSKQSSRNLAVALSKLGVVSNCWHFYSRRLADRLGAHPDDGFLRLSFAHYNTEDEISRVNTIFDEVA